MRIDAVLVPRFVDECPRIGLEIKAFWSRKDVSVGDYARHLKQCVDYSLCKFNGKLLDMVLAYPGLCFGPTHSEFFKDTRDLAIRLGAPFRVGELVPVREGFEIRIGDTPLWRSSLGLTGVGARFHWRRKV
ncbi:MAG: hypothetical protein C4337_06250 [Armatimonadota bacterium]